MGWTAAGAAFAVRPQTARAAGRPVRIGVLNDQSGVFSDSSGPGSSLAAQLAAEDAEAMLGLKAEIVSADHGNKADVGAVIAREWFDRDGVDAVADLGNSAVALAVANICREKDKACLISAGGTTLLTGAQCAPTTVQWTYDTYAETTALAKALTEAGKTSWFFITVDYAFGLSLQDETTRALTRLGGKVVGAIRHPLGTTDFSSYLLQAQASGAQVIALANGGDDTARCVKQAAEFGVGGKQTLVGLSMLITDVHAVGLDAAQGLFLTETFYWDLTGCGNSASQTGCETIAALKASATMANPRIPYRLSSSVPPLPSLEGKRILVHLVVNVEHWVFEQPMPRTIITPPHGRETVPDVPNFSWADYGMHAGLPRLLDLLEGLPVSTSFNAGVIDAYPQAADAMLKAGWEFTRTACTNAPPTTSTAAKRP